MTAVILLTHIPVLLGCAVTYSTGGGGDLAVSSPGSSEEDGLLRLTRSCRHDTLWGQTSGSNARVMLLKLSLTKIALTPAVLLRGPYRTRASPYRIVGIVRHYLQVFEQLGGVLETTRSISLPR